ncbi:hypothetical protein J2S76_003782 [Ancylobacter vacuolatus]|uniref:Uncharacterized protein n=1 Tax=Ancylobacter vacuolatus TaxID=223389 RepID=A0ABU0DLM4_9HYPH|nr:hypothetical protein [Ancylobacter vacuolatus]
MKLEPVAHQNKASEAQEKSEGLKRPWNAPVLRAVIVADLTEQDTVNADDGNSIGSFS